MDATAAAPPTTTTHKQEDRKAPCHEPAITLYPRTPPALALDAVTTATDSARHNTRRMKRLPACVDSTSGGRFPPPRQHQHNSTVTPRHHNTTLPYDDYRSTATQSKHNHDTTTMPEATARDEREVLFPAAPTHCNTAAPQAPSGGRGLVH